MRRMRSLQGLVIGAATALALAACGGGGGGGGDTGGGNAGGGGGNAKGKSVRVGLVYDVGGRGDKSFNDASYAGLTKAKAELGVEIKDLSPSGGGADREELLRLLASSGYNPVIAVGFAFQPAIDKIAPQLPQTNFAIVDAVVNKPNVASLTFAAEQASFLVGAAAAMKTKTGHVGFIGGVNVPLLQAFQAGFDAGAQHVKKTIKVDDKYLTNPPDFSGFASPDKGKEAATGMYDAGADVIYAAAGGSGTGVFQAAKAAGTYAIGVDSDQYLSAPPSVRDVILTSALKRVDVAVFDFVKAFVDGNRWSGEHKFDLKNDGVGYATSGGKIDDIKAKLEALKQQIVTGAVTVPSTPGK